MKFALLLATLAVAIGVSLARAQEQAATPADAPPAHQMPTGPGVDMARLCAHVSSEANFYPDHAHDQHIEGYAMLECALDSGNRLETCWLLSEKPEGERFGPAALFSACHMRERPLERMPRDFHVDGDTRVHIEMPIYFRLAGDITR